jgi:uncharacterized protein (TIGR01777 family)
MPEKALITGGSGLIGTRMTEMLLAKGWQVAHLGRQERKGSVPTFRWDPAKGYIDSNAFEGVTKIVHLAGASIAGKRWTESYKREILDSRVRTTRLLFEHLSKAKGTINRVISASAIGIYGAGSVNEVFSEERSDGDGFLAEVVSKWEAEVNRISSLGISVATVRTGIVLSNKGGALVQMARPIRFGLGAPLGTGDQVISWIHIDDICGIYLYLLDRDLPGPFNATAPHPVTNEELTEAIARELGRPLWLPNIPVFILKVALGELATAVLTGSNVSSNKIATAGYSFSFRDIETALRSLL